MKKIMKNSRNMEVALYALTLVALLQCICPSVLANPETEIATTFREAFLKPRFSAEEKRETVDYITGYLKQRKFEPKIHEFLYKGKSHGKNIVVLPGVNEKNPVLILTAHYDTAKGSPGVIDSGSSSVALLRIAHQLSTDCKRYHKMSVAMIWFDLENNNNAGSKIWVEQELPKLFGSRKVHGIFNLDKLLVYNSKINSQKAVYNANAAFWKSIEANNKAGDFITAIVRANDKFLADALKNSVRQLKMPNRVLKVNEIREQDKSNSDHKSFWAKGYYAVSLYDQSHGREPSKGNILHTKHDDGRFLTSENLAFMNRVIEIMVETVKRLALCLVK